MWFKKKKKNCGAVYGDEYSQKEMKKRKEEALEFYNDYMEEYADELVMYGMMQEMRHDENMLGGNDDK